MPEGPITLTRKAFYDLVWSEPMSRLAQKYGLSDVALAKKCKRHNIPRPTRGWWTQRRAGYTVQQIPLPGGDDRTLIKIIPNTQAAEIRDRSSRLLKVISAERKSSLPIIVPEELTNPHSLILLSSPILESGTPDHTGRLCATEAGCLDILVSPNCLSRALLIMDTLIKVLNALGYDVLLSENRTKVRIDDESIAIALSEEVVRKRLRAEDHNLDGYYEFGYGLYEKKFSPSGELCLSIERDARHPYPPCRLYWKDVGVRKLEKSLNSFVASLLKTAAMQRMARLGEQESAQEPLG